MNTNDDKCHHCNILADVVSRQSKADDDVAESKINENKYLKICATTKKLYENLVQLCSCDEPEPGPEPEPATEIELHPWFSEWSRETRIEELAGLPPVEYDLIWEHRDTVYLEYNSADDIGRVAVWIKMPDMDDWEDPQRCKNICWSISGGCFHFIPGVWDA